MEEFLYQHLSAGLGKPVSWGDLGSGTELPRVSLYRVSGVDDVTLEGRSGWLDGRVQVDCYGATYAQALGVSRAVTTLLSGYQGGPIWRAALQGIRDLTDEEGGEVIHRVSMDFAVSYRE